MTEDTTEKSTAKKTYPKATFETNDNIMRSLFYNGIFTSEECERIKKAATNPDYTQRFQELQTRHLPGFRQYTPPGVEVLSREESNKWLRDHLFATLDILNQRHYHFEITELAEIQRITLKTGQGMPWHTTLGTGPFAHNKLCCMVFLNSVEKDYTGGAFQSMSGFGRQEQQQGNLVIYPAMNTLCLNPVKSGQMEIIHAVVRGSRPLR